MSCTPLSLLYGGAPVTDRRQVGAGAQMQGFDPDSLQPAAGPLGVIGFHQRGFDVIPESDCQAGNGGDDAAEPGYRGDG